MTDTQKETLEKMYALQKEYDAKDKRVGKNTVLCAVAGGLLYFAGAIGLNVATQYNPHKNAPAVKQNISMHQTLNELKYVRQDAERAISVKDSKLSYSTEEVKPFIDDAFASKEKEVSSLDGAIKIIEADLQKSNELPEIVAYEKFQSRSGLGFVSGLIISGVMVVGSLIYSARSRRKNEDEYFKKVYEVIKKDFDKEGTEK